MDSGDAHPVDAERTLVREARSGSRDALNRLLSRCSPVVQHYLERQVGRRLRRYASIADMRQDVLLRCVEALEHLPDEATVRDFESLLLRHARWAVLKAARSRRQTAYASDLLPRDAGSPDPADTLRTTGTVTRQDQHRWLNRLLEGLDEPLAAVARLRLGGATFGAIADELGIGEDAARKRFLHASRQLRERGGVG